MFVNRNCRDRWHKITPAGSKRHSDIAFFLSSQPSPHTLHPHQIFFYSGLRGCEEGGCAESWPTLNADILLSTLLQFLILPHDCACTHTCNMKRCTQSTCHCFLFFYILYIYIFTPGQKTVLIFSVGLTITCLNLGNHWHECFIWGTVAVWCIQWSRVFLIFIPVKGGMNLTYQTIWQINQLWK